MKKLDLDKGKIRELYLEKGFSLQKIAKIFGVSKKTIHRRLESLKIERRKTKLILDENKIRDLYLKKKKNSYEIADILNVSANTIRRRLKKNGINLRTKKLKLDEKKIKDLYVNQKKSGAEIAKILNVSHHPIYCNLEEAGIKRSTKIDLDLDEIKDLYVNKGKSMEDIAKIVGVGHTTIFRRLNNLGIEIRKRRLNLDENKIKELYLNKKNSAKEIGKVFGVSDITILNRLKQIGVRIRNNSESHTIKLNIKKIKDLYFNKRKSTTEIGKLMNVSEWVIKNRLHKEKLKLRTNGQKGEKHHNFNNWASREPYGVEFSPELKEQVRKRDNFTCQECGKTEEQLRKKLFTHHIDYNKKNNIPLNFISLCNKCHTKTNYNRKHWERYFKNIMALREIFNPDNLLIFDKNKKLIGMERIK